MTDADRKRCEQLVEVKRVAADMASAVSRMKALLDDLRTYRTVTGEVFEWSAVTTCLDNLKRGFLLIGDGTEPIRKAADAAERLLAEQRAVPAAE